ncbi:TadE-like protein [Gimesia panareensis]|uniref:TadE-like protein n=1 Tax=Gimesia panareensis TaxID=2527978 RepID=A0A517Q3C7_9PLAN|nr:TadE/TadG family type IV pilus assembly protein [Gimesia panareensis]QDT26109.1 TadE-like protein [Gimesia panareensis]
MKRNGLSTWDRNQPKRPADLKHRRGSVLLEFILAFPIILMLSLAIIEFGFYTLLQQSITAAAIEGTRKAAQVGATKNDIGNLIQQYVAVNSLDLSVGTQPASSGQGDVFVSIQDGTTTLSTTMGNSDIPCSPVGPPPSDGSTWPAEIKVTICVNLTDTNGTFPIPNLLYLFGFSLSGKQLEISAMTVLE